MEISGTNVGVLAGMTTAATMPTSAATAPATAAETRSAAYEPRDLGLSVLQAEIRQVLSARLKFSFGGSGYDSAKLSATAVAKESLTAASWLLREAPLEAADELRDLRDEIEDAGDATRQLVADDDLPDVEEALTRIDDGLDRIGDEAARNIESSASVLTAESTIRQRSTVRIRTQDGDIVTLTFRQRESFSGLSAADASGSITELEMSSRTRMDLKVRGDLDDGEMQAIQAVFDRAQEIAGSFFGGDLAEAFAKASELEFDDSELAKVRMNFREQEVTRIRFAQIDPYPVLQPAVPASPVELPAVDAPASAGVASDVSSEVLPDASPKSLPDVTANESDAVVASSDAEPVNTVTESAAPATETAGAIERFVVEIREFLRSTTQGFEKSDGQRYFYSESFKLSLLRSVIEASAPAQPVEAGDRAVSIVDAINETEQA